MSEERDVDEVKVNLTLRDTGNLEVRTLLLGNGPIVLIEGEDADETSVTLSVDATDLEREDLADMLELVAHVVRNGKDET